MNKPNEPYIYATSLTLISQKTFKSPFRPEAHFSQHLIILLAGLIYSFVFFYRNSLAPILDVLEDEFHATSTEIGMMSSTLWLGYFTLQFPAGFILEKFAVEFVIFVSAVCLSVASFLFGISTNITFASIALAFSGVSVSCVFLATIALVGQKLGNNYIPIWNGIIYFYTFHFLLGMNYVQSYLWMQHEMWRPVYYAVSGSVLFISIIFLFVKICTKRQQINQMNASDGIRINKKQASPAKPLEAGIELSNPSVNTAGEEKLDAPSPVVSAQSQNAEQPLLATDADNIKWYMSVYRTRVKASGSNLGCKLIKAALFNHWNYIVGFYVFSVAALLYAFNGLWLIMFLMTKYNMDRGVASIVSNLFYISSAIVGVIMGQLSTKYKKKKIFLMMSATMCFCSVLIIYLPADTHIGLIITLNIISGGGCGTLPIAFAICREYNEYYHCADVAGGLVNTIGTSAGFVVQYLVGVLIDMNWESRKGKLNEDGDRVYTANDYEFAFIVIPVTCGLAFILTLLLKETNGETLKPSKIKQNKA